MRPPYQRGYVWKDDFKDKLIFSIINLYPIGSFSMRVLSQRNSKGAGIEVVDGQQRLTTIKDFVDGTYIIKSEWSRKIIMTIQDKYLIEGDENYASVKKLCKKLENAKKIKLKFSDLPPIVQGKIMNYDLALTNIRNASDESIREYFRFLQNQERLRAGELINSMPASNLESYLNEVESKELFLDKIGFSDDRAEFDKIFYSLIGLYDLKIPFGTTDRKILTYASKSDTPREGLEATQNMIKQVNIVSQSDITPLENTRKRYLKYFLLLAGLGKVNFSDNIQEKLSILAEIDNKLSVFFSAKASAITDAFQGYPDSVIEELRLIAILSKGCHPLSRVENRMDILAHYVNTNDFSRPSSITIEG